MVTLGTRLLFIGMEDHQLGTMEAATLDGDKSWSALRDIFASFQSRRVVLWLEGIDEMYPSFLTGNQTFTSRTVAPLGVGNLFNESQYESTRYYWFDPFWGQPESVEFYPTCNTLHEVDLSQIDFLEGDGAFRLSALYNPSQRHLGLAHLRMTHLDRPWSRADVIMSMNDATAMEHVQSSPYIVSIYNACGASMMSEFMAGGRLGNQLGVRTQGRNVKYFPMKRLRYAVQSTRAVVDIHVVNIANMDLQVKNLMLDETDQVHLNDFNLARLPSLTAPIPMKRNQEHDIFMLGKVYYWIRTGRPLKMDLDRVWKVTRNDSNMEKLIDRVKGLNFSRLTEGKASHRATLALSTLEWCASACLQPTLPSDRPTAKQLLNALEKAQEAISNRANMTSLNQLRNTLNNAIAMLDLD